MVPNRVRGLSALVIGGSGFIEKAIVDHLLSLGCQVTLLNRGNRPIPGTKQLKADRNSLSEMKSTLELTGTFDVVIDTSAYTGPAVEIAWNLLRQKTSRWIHLSSAAVYVETPDRAPAESDPIGGAKIWGEYGREKSDADKFLLSHSHEMPVSILRAAYFYGPENDLDRERFIWSRLLRDRAVLIPGDGETPMQFVHVKDLALMVEAILTKNPRSSVFNLTPPETVTQRQYVSALASIAMTKDLGILVGSKADDFTPRQYFPFRNYPCWLDGEKTKALLGWKPVHSFKDGFTATLAALNPNELKSRQLETKIEDEILKRVSAL